jgi:hypothetical protein
VLECFQDLDLAQGCHRHAFLLVMHQNSF